PLPKGEGEKNIWSLTRTAFGVCYARHEPTNFGPPERRDHRRGSHQTATTSLGLVVGGGHRAFPLHRLTRIVHFHFGCLVWIAGFLGSVLVHLQDEDRSIRDLFRPHGINPA